jgi:hypothetical protein
MDKRKPPGIFPAVQIMGKLLDYLINWVLDIDIVQIVLPGD